MKTTSHLQTITLASFTVAAALAGAARAADPATPQ